MLILLVLAEKFPVDMLRKNRREMIECTRIWHILNETKTVNKKLWKMQEHATGGGGGEFVH